MQNFNPPQLLNCFAKWDYDHINRYLFDDGKARYIMIKHDTYPHYRHSGALPQIPGGDWNWGVVAKDPSTGLPHFQETARKQFAGVTSAWHPSTYKHMILNLYERKGNLKIYMHVRLDMFAVEGVGVPTVVKVARVEEEIPRIETECAIYGLIQNLGIAPKFRGYVSEDGRKIGFIVEEIEGARLPEADDIDACVTVLKKLHDLGIVHGDGHSGNFLIKDGRAWLIDFEAARDMEDAGDGDKDDRLYRSLKVSRDGSHEK